LFASQNSFGVAAKKNSVVGSPKNVCSISGSLSTMPQMFVTCRPVPRPPWMSSPFCSRELSVMFTPSKCSVSLP
jgi:hypothetical protein